MPNIRKFFVAVLALSSAQLMAKPAPHYSAIAPIFLANGTDTGLAVITRVRGKTVLKISLNGLTPGAHGLHLHSTGSCKGDGFSRAGAHLNPGSHMHGKLNPAGSHLGDLPNLTADASGNVVTEIPVSMNIKSLFTAMFDADGTSIVIHTAADDYATDPSGNSGARIACGVFRRK